MSGVKTTTIRMSDDAHAYASAAAKKKGLSLSGYISSLVSGEKRKMRVVIKNKDLIYNNHYGTVIGSWVEGEAYDITSCALVLVDGCGVTLKLNSSQFKPLCSGDWV